MNREELDRIIDRATNVSLSKADFQKLNTALHTMADRLTGKRSTEKDQCRSCQFGGPSAQSGARYR